MDEMTFRINQNGNCAGESTLSICYDNVTVHLHSQYDVNHLAMVWAGQTDLSNFQSVAVVYGIADGLYLSKLREWYPELLIIAYEPMLQLTERLEHSSTYRSICTDDRILIYSGFDQISAWRSALQQAIQYENQQYVKFLVSPNYELLFPEDVAEKRRMILDVAEANVIDRNTLFAFSEKISRNFADNVLDCTMSPSVNELYYEFSRIDKEKIPVIIVASGPSLDKNIEELKKAKGKALIIATDSALNVLAKHDIEPDLAVTVDPVKDVRLFQNEKMAKVPLLYLLASNPEIRKYHRGKRIYFWGNDTLMDVYFDRYHKKPEALESGGSVANDAFSFAHKFGFRTIIFIGQDLAYPNDIQHAKGAYEDLAKNVVSDSDGKTYFYVEDIYGNQVRTESNMDAYRKWYEKKIQQYPTLRVIDATEGGAKIYGTEIMTLAQAITECCSFEGTVDFTGLIESTPAFFTAEEQDEIVNELSQFDARMEAVKHKIEEGQYLFEKLLRYGKGITKEDPGKLLKRITAFNEWVLSPEVSFLTIYTAEEDYAIKDTIYDTTESVDAEIVMIAENGIRSVKSLLNACDRLMEDMQATMSEAKKISPAV